MAEYIPFEEIDPILVADSALVDTGADRWHLRVSMNEIVFNGAYEVWVINVTNVGWDNLIFNQIVAIGSIEVIEALPEKLLPGNTYSFTVRQAEAVDSDAGIYIDVGDSYGNKFINITTVI